MSSLAIERVRADAARTFADAFVLRSRRSEMSSDEPSAEADLDGDAPSTAPLILKPTPP